MFATYEQLRQCHEKRLFCADGTLRDLARMITYLEEKVASFEQIESELKAEAYYRCRDAS